MNFSDELRNFINDRPLYLFTGAGISWLPPSSLPLGNELIEILLDKIISLSYLKKYRFPELLRPEVVMQTLLNYFGDDVIYGLKCFSEVGPNPNHKLINILFEAKIISKIYTTNLDTCHEKASTTGNISTFVTHLHGISENPKTILYSLNQVASNKLANLSKLIQFECTNSVILFLGYSGRDDFDISPFLKKLNSNFKFIWVDHNNSSSWSITNDFSASSSSNILVSRNPNTVLYIKGNTTKFLKSLLDINSIPLNDFEQDLSQNKIWQIRKSNLAIIKKKISKQLNGYPTEVGICLAAELLTLYLNNPEESIKLLGDVTNSSSSEYSYNYYRIKGLSERKIGDYDQAEISLKKAIKINELSSPILRLLSDVNYRKNHYKPAIDYINKSISKANNSLDKAYAYATKALILQDFEQEKDALKLYTKSINILKREVDVYGLSDIINNRGILYLDENQLKFAKKDFKEALELRKLINYKQGICYCNLNLGIISRFEYCKGYGQKYATDSHKYFNNALEILPSKGGNLDRALIFKNCGDLFMDQMLLYYSDIYLNKALSTFKKLNENGLVFSCNISLLELNILLKKKHNVSRILLKLNELSKYDQLPDKINWFNTIKLGIEEGFDKIELDSLPVPIYLHRIKQMIDL